MNLNTNPGEHPMEPLVSWATVVSFWTILGAAALLLIRHR
jgi:hypothetical protein